MNTLTMDAWLNQTLTGDSTLMALQVNSLPISAVYAEEAPEDAVMPFILFNAVSDPTDVLGVGTTRIQTNCPYVVRVIAKRATFAELQPVADRIDLLLHGKGPVSPLTGKWMLACYREAEFKMAEKDAGVEIRHLGGRYQVSAQ